MARGSNFGFRKQRICTIYVAKTKALISFTVTAKLICVFVFAYAKIRFTHDEAHFSYDVQYFEISLKLYKSEHTLLIQY